MKIAQSGGSAGEISRNADGVASPSPSHPVTALPPVTRASRRWARGISEKILAQTLRTLEADGLVLREQRPVIPPHVDYSLTDRGRELSALLLPLMNWIIAYAPQQP